MGVRRGSVGGPSGDFLALGAVLDPRWPPYPSKSPSRPAQDPSKPPFERILEPLGMSFYKMLDPLGIDFERILDLKTMHP